MPIRAESFSALTTMVDLLQWRARHQSDQAAYTFLADGETAADALTYAELDRQARAIGAYLQAEGMTGERALLCYPPGLEYIAAFFGCLYAGLTAVPAYPPLLNRSLRRIRAIATDAQARLALVPASVAANLEAIVTQVPALAALRYLTTSQVADGREANWCSPAVTRQTLAMLQYTSGSTREPRGVMIGHGNLMHNLACMASAVEGTPYKAEPAPYGRDPSRYGVAVSWLPPYHDMGLVGGILMPLYGGRPAVLMSPAAFLQHPDRWLRAISHYQATSSIAPNFAYDLCVRRITPAQRQTLRLHCWRLAFWGAEPVRPLTLERFVAVFGPCGVRREALYPSYGLAEATLMVSGGQPEAPPVVRTFQRQALANHRVAETAGESEAGVALVGCGQTLRGQRLLIVDPETHTVCPPGHIGEIWMAGGSVAQGYWNRPAETAETFEARLADTREGPFLRTGDLGFLEHGELFVTGRIKDLIILRGANYDPHDIELTVQESHAALRPNCGAAFAVDAAGEERLVVVQEVERPAQLEADAVVKAVCQAVASVHGLPLYTLVLVRPGSIPKTSSGKIPRRMTRSAFLERTLQVVSVWQEDATSAGKPWWRDVLRPRRGAPGREEADRTS